MANKNMFGLRLLVLYVTASSIAYSKQRPDPGPGAEAESTCERPSPATLLLYNSARDSLEARVMRMDEICVPTLGNLKAEEHVCCYDGLKKTECCKTTLLHPSQPSFTATRSGAASLGNSLFSSHPNFSRLKWFRQDEVYDWSISSELCYYQTTLASDSPPTNQGIHHSLTSPDISLYHEAIHHSLSTSRSSLGYSEDIYHSISTPARSLDYHEDINHYSSPASSLDYHEDINHSPISPDDSLDYHEDINHSPSSSDSSLGYHEAIHHSISTSASILGYREDINHYSSPPRSLDYHEAIHHSLSSHASNLNYHEAIHHSASRLGYHEDIHRSLNPPASRLSYHEGIHHSLSTPASALNYHEAINDSLNNPESPVECREHIHHYSLVESRVDSCEAIHRSLTSPANNMCYHEVMNQSLNSPTSSLEYYEAIHISPENILEYHERINDSLSSPEISLDYNETKDHSYNPASGNMNPIEAIHHFSSTSIGANSHQAIYHYLSSPSSSLGYRLAKHPSYFPATSYLDYYESQPYLSSPSSNLGYHESKHQSYSSDSRILGYSSLYTSKIRSWTSFFQIPPYAARTSGLTQEAQLYILIVGSGSATLDIELEPFTPTENVACSVGKTTVVCSYDQSFKKLTVSLTSVSSSLKLIINDLIYPSTPGLYNLPIQVTIDSSSYSTYSSIIVMPSVAPGTLSVSFAHKDAEQYNLIFATLEPSSGGFAKGDTISIYFPAEEPGSSDHDYSLGLCTKYDFYGYSLICATDSIINNYDEIPCVNFNDQSLSITCRLIFGNNLLNRPAVVEATVNSNVQGSIVLTFMLKSPYRTNYYLPIIMRLSGDYEGGTQNIQFDRVYSRNQQMKSYGIKPNELMFLTDYTPSSLIIFTNQGLLNVPGNKIHAGAIPSMNLIWVPGRCTSYQSGVCKLSLIPSTNPGMSLSNYILIYNINSNSNIVEYLFGLQGENPNYGITLQRNIIDSTSFIDRSLLVLNKDVWVTMNISPYYVTGLNSQIKITLTGGKFMGNHCRLSGSKGSLALNFETGSCTIDNSQTILTARYFSPHEEGSIYAIDITKPDAILIEARVMLTTCNFNQVGFKVEHYGDISESPNDIFTYKYTTNLCSSTITDFNIYTPILEELPHNAVRCTDTGCDNYGEIRFKILSSNGNLNSKTIKVDTGGLLTTKVSTTSKLRCELIDSTGRSLLNCSQGNTNDDFIISSGEIINGFVEIIITTEGDDYGNNKGFRIPLDPVPITISVYDGTTLLQYYKDYYYPPTHILDDFYLEFMHYNKEVQNVITVYAEYSLADGTEDFILTFLPEDAPYKLTLSESAFVNGDELPCAFTSCLNCKCIFMQGNSIISQPHQVKVTGLNLSQGESFHIMGIIIRNSDSISSYDFRAQVWNSTGKLLAVSIYSFSLTSFTAKYISNSITNANIDCIELAEGDPQYHEFELTLSNSLEASACLFEFSMFTGFDDLYKYIDTSVGSNVFASSAIYRNWVYTKNPALGTSYIPFRMKAPVSKASQDRIIVQGIVYCINENSLDVTDTYLVTAPTNRNNSNFQFRSKGDTLTVASEFGAVVKSQRNLLRVTYTLTSPYIISKVNRIELIFTSGSYDGPYGYYAVFADTKLPQYAADYTSNSLIIRFDSYITISGTITIVFGYIPNANFTVTYKIYKISGSNQEIKHSKQSDTVSVETGNGSFELFSTDTSSGRPISSVNPLSFSIQYTSQTEASSITLSFPSAYYRIVNDFTVFDTCTISCDPLNCSYVSKNKDSITWNRGTSRMSLMNINISCTYTGSSQLNVRPEGILSAVITEDTFKSYKIADFSAYDTTFTLKGFPGADNCVSVLEFKLRFGISILQYDTIRFQVEANRTLYAWFNAVVTTGTSVLNFNCIIELFDSRPSSSFSCMYLGSDPLDSELTILFHGYFTQLDNYNIRLMRSAGDTYSVLYKKSANILRKNSDNTCYTLQGNAPDIVGTIEDIISYDFSDGGPYTDDIYFVLQCDYCIDIEAVSNVVVFYPKPFGYAYLKPKLPEGETEIGSFRLNFFINHTSSSSLSYMNMFYEKHKTFLISATTTQAIGPAFIKNTRTNDLTFYSYESANIQIYNIFTRGVVNKLVLLCESNVKIYIGEIRLYSANDPDLTLVPKFKYTYDYEITISYTFEKNLTYIISGLKFHIRSSANSSCTLTSYYDSYIKNTKSYTLTVNSSISYLSFSSLRDVLVTTPYRFPESNSINSFYIIAKLPAISTGDDSVYRGKLKLTAVSGLSLVEDNYYSFITPVNDRSRLAWKILVKCKKETEADIACFMPKRLSSSAGDYIIRFGSPTMKKAAFKATESVINLKLEYSTTSTATTPASFDISSTFTLYYNPIPSVKMDYIQLPNNNDSIGIRSLYFQAPKSIAAGDKAFLEAPALDDLFGTSYILDNAYRNNIPKENIRNYCQVYAPELKDTYCYFYMYYQETTPSVRYPSYLFIMFNEAIPKDTTVEIFFGKIKLYDLYIGSGFKLTLNLGGVVYQTKVYDAYKKIFADEPTISDKQLPTISLYNGINIEVTIDNAYNRAKKGYFFIEAYSELVKISPATKSYISSPSGKGYKNMMAGIMLDTVSDSTITLRLENSGPYSAPESSTSPTINVSVIQDGIVVSKYLYSGAYLIQIQHRFLTSLTACFSSLKLDGIRPQTEVEFTITLQNDLVATSNLVIDLPEVYHNSAFDSIISCYAKHEGLNWGQCIVGSKSSGVYRISISANSYMLAGSLIQVYVQIFNPTAEAPIAYRTTYDIGITDIGTIPGVFDYCTKCEANQYITPAPTATCVADCSTIGAYYGNTQASKCLECLPNCARCSDGINCDRCDDSSFHYSLNGKVSCISTCPVNKFPDTAKRTCEDCVSNCSVCLTASTCSSCNSGYYLSDNKTKCVAICPAGTYKGTTNPKTCISCFENCAECSNGSSCSACAALYYLNNNKSSCVGTCSTGFYKSTVTPLECRSCINFCAECSASTPNLCTRCLTGYYLNKAGDKCVAQCEDGTYGNEETSTCTDCDDKCAKCTQAGSCTECKDDKYVKGNECVSVCDGDGYRAQETPVKACFQSIENCSAIVYPCSSCNENYFLYEDGTQCINECGPVGKFVSIQTPKTCTDCIASCDTCSSKSACTVCSSNTNLQPDGTCKSGCPARFYPNESRVCTACLPSCKTCTNGSECQECIDQFYLYNDGASCVGSCSTGFYTTSNPLYCKPCATNCINCTGPSTCTRCDTNYFLADDGARCINSCTNGYYEDTSATVPTCGSCKDDCNTCTNNTDCSECKNSLYLDKAKSSCGSTCPDGTYRGVISSVNTCIRCGETIPDCARCDDTPTCTVCTSDKYLVQATGQCVTTCPDRYIPITTNPKRCILCMNNCIACTDLSTCSQCADGFDYVTSPTPRCLPPCEAKYYRNSQGVCARCMSTCASCENGSECTKCNEGLYLLIDSTKQCASTCPDSYYGDSASPASCRKCTNNCKKCENSSSCAACERGYYLATSSSCEACPRECETCDIVNGKAVCTLCAQGLYMHENTCLNTCPRKFYPISSTRICSACKAGTYSRQGSCKACPNLCTECSSDKNCTICTQNAKLNSSSLCECIKNYEVKGNTCIKKKVKYELVYISATKSVELRLSVPLQTPLSKKSIKIVIIIKIQARESTTGHKTVDKEEVLSEDDYDIIANSSNDLYTIQILNDLAGVASLKFSIVNPEIYTDEEGNPIDESEYEITIDEPNIIPEEPIEEDGSSDDENEFKDAVVDIISPIMMCFCAAAIAVGFFLPNSLYIWNSINFLQILSFMYFIDLEWPDTLSDFLPSILYYNYFPNIFHLIEEEGPSPFDNAEDLGYDTSQFLRNNGVIITFFIGVALLWPFIFILAKLAGSHSSMFSVNLKKLCVTYNWNAYLKVLIETYLVAAITCLLQLKYTSYDSANLVINFISGLIAIIIVSLAPILILAKIILNRKNLESDKLVFKYGSLYKELNYIKHPQVIYFYPLNMFRKLLLAINYVAIQQSTTAQLIINLVLCLAGFLYAVIVKPYARKLENVINIISESVLVLVSALIFGFIEDDIEGIEWAVTIIIIAGFFTNISVLILNLALKVITHRKALRAQSPKVSSEKVNLVNQELPALDADSISPGSQQSFIKGETPINNETSRKEAWKVASPLAVEDLNSI